jgi:hypothetical protein
VLEDEEEKTALLAERLRKGAVQTIEVTPSVYRDGTASAYRQASRAWTQAGDEYSAHDDQLEAAVIARAKQLATEEAAAQVRRGMQGRGGGADG